MKRVKTPNTEMRTRDERETLFNAPNGEQKRERVGVCIE
jgi:hypothetical protein